MTPVGKIGLVRSGSGTMGDVCRLLSKEDVSKAIGVEIVRTESEDNGCSYIAKGTQADMTAKHVTAMMAREARTRRHSNIAKNLPEVCSRCSRQKSLNPNRTLLEKCRYSISQSINRRRRTDAPQCQGSGNRGYARIPGIGDQAFVSADGMIMVRKGKSLIRIMFITCPCGVEQVKPLAKQIADAL